VDSIWAESSRRFWSDQAGDTLRYTAGAYQPSPMPSPFVGSAPMRAWRLWSTMPCEVLKSSALATTGTAAMRDGSDGTRTRDLRRDRPAL
jgi:hypothetical protein